MSKKINFTVTAIKNLPNAKTGSRNYYYDLKTSGLGVMVFPSSAKTFFLYRRVGTAPSKIKLGKFPETSIEQARTRAISTLNEIACGINPNKDKQRLRNETTFAALADRFINQYSKERKRSWKNDVGYYTNHLKTLDSKALSMITRTHVEKLHNEIKNKAGLYTANRSLALLKTMFSRAIDWGFTGNNPATKIKKFPEEARDRALQPHELNSFFEALNNEPSVIFKNYFYISLFTGARRSNVLGMRWEDLMLGDNAEWRIPMTKNGEAQIVSLVPQAVDILVNLKKDSASKWVFPSVTSKSGHIEEPKKVWKAILARASITNLRIHDLRRTMASWQVRTGANSFIIGKTLGHKSQQATAIYARVSKDVARESMENAVNAMFECRK